MKRIPTLDGWRGIAIAMVLFDHVQHVTLGHYLHPWLQTGGHGVTIFFVISGFLITSKLLESPIDLRRFYVQRFFRLMPAAWTYLAVIVLFGEIVHFPLTSIPEVASCVFFFRNYIEPPGPRLAAHFWSLSLEEQFYLLWPCILLLAGARRCRWIAALGVLACVIYRALYLTTHGHPVAYTFIQARADELLLGCLLALLMQDERFRAMIRRWSTAWALPALLCLLYSIAHCHWIPPIYESLSITGLIAASVFHPTSIPARLLQVRPLEWLGAVSYSLYLWQQFFLIKWPQPAFTLLLCIGLPVCALGSYYLIERPMIQFGRRLTSSRRDASLPLAPAQLSV